MTSYDIDDDSIESSRGRKKFPTILLFQNPPINNKDSSSSFNDERDEGGVSSVDLNHSPQSSSSDDDSGSSYASLSDSDDGANRLGILGSQDHFISTSRKLLSRSHEERIIQVLIQKHGEIEKNSLEKLGTYVLEEDESVVEPFDNSVSKATQEEEFSLHLSRTTGTGTGSYQHDLWIREVNIAVGRLQKPPCDEIATSRHSSAEIVSPVETSNSPAPQEGDSSEQSLENDPTTRNTLLVISPSNRVDLHQYSERHTLSQTYAHTNTLVEENKTLFQEKQLIVQPFKKERQLQNSQSQQVSSQYLTSLTSPQGDESALEKHSSIGTPRTNNSRLIMAKLEGKYKNLRGNLARENQIDDDGVFSDDGLRYSYDSPSQDRQVSAIKGNYKRGAPNSSTNPVKTMVSAFIPSKEALRMDYAGRDPFSLGMLSTRSSGILSANSWESDMSEESDRSLQRRTRGCGIFLCD